MAANATANGRILFMTSGVHLLIMKDGSHFPTGYWSKQLRTTYRVFREADYLVDCATLGGQRAVPDQRSLQGEDLSTPDEMRQGLDHPLRLEDVDLAQYAAILVPGGHGVLQDLAANPTAGRMLTEMHEDGRPIGGVCHGPAAMLAAKRPDGSATFADFQMTGCTDQEEEQSGLAPNMRVLLQDSLEAMGARFVAGTPFEPHVENDRGVFTAQNGESSALIAQRMLDSLHSSATIFL